MAPTKQISTSQGFQDSKGTVVANGMLMLQLSQTATVTASGGQVTTEPIYLNLDANGKITATAIWFVDELSPSGLIYYGTVFASNKTRMIPGLEKLQYSITGASFDLATAVQSGSASPSFSGAVLLTPTGNQTITTGNLTLTTGSFVETANTVTGSGGLVRATSPTLVTPNIGVATATSVNKVALTTPATAATLTIANNKTLTANASLTFTGTDGTTHTFPGTSGTVAELNAANIFSADQTCTAQTLIKRIRATQASSILTTDIGSISGGWGTTATCSAVSGTDMGGSITISSSGTGQAANPSFAFTFHDGTWTNAPTVIAIRGDGSGPVTGTWSVTTITATAVTIFFIGTPIAGNTYICRFMCIGN